MTVDAGERAARGRPLAPLRDGDAWRRWTSSSLFVRGAVFLAPFTLAFAVYLGAYLVMHPAATGDEPHYYLIAESIVYDGDVDLANDYASPARVLAVCQCFPLVSTATDRGAHAFRYTNGGGLVPWHGLGLPLLLAPVVGLAGLGLGGLTLVRIFMVLLAALMADQLYRLLVDLNFARPRSRWLAWGATVFSVPLITFANQIYAEVVGALLLLVATRVIVRGRTQSRALVTGAVAGAALPWLQTRYLPLSLFVLVALLYILARGPRRASAPTDAPKPPLADRARAAVGLWRTNLAQRRLAVGLGVFLPYAVSLGLLALTFQRLYGSPFPDAPYRPTGFGTVGSAGWKFWYEWFLADVLDPGVGWIPYAPVMWLGLAGIVCLYRRFGWRALALGGAALAYALLVASTGVPAGTGFPARYLVTVIPLAAVPLALVLDTVREARVVFVPLLVLSAVIAVAALLDYQALYPYARERHHEARLFAVRSIQTAFPRPRLVSVGTSDVDDPGEFPPQTGRLSNGRIVASSARGDAPGFVIWGPYAKLRAGQYRATFAVAARGPRRQQIARIEVAQRGRVLAARGVTPADVRPWPQLTRFVLRFATVGGYEVETRVFFNGQGTVAAGATQITPTGETAQPFPPVKFSDWPLAFLWLAGTALVAVLFARVSGATLALGSRPSA